jgi:hypothetical protein
MQPKPTDQEIYEAQEILDAAELAQDARPIDCYPPTARQVADAHRTLRAAGIER